MTANIDVSVGDPMKLFHLWFKNAENDPSVGSPGIFSFATATRDGVPSNRSLHLRGLTDNGFQLFTSSESQKGRELEENPICAMVFCWSTDLSDGSYRARQVRITGAVSKMDRQESLEYFSKEPISSQIRANLRQSTPISSLEEQEILVEEIKKQHESGFVAPPDYWGGYFVKPEMMEFYFGTRDGINERVRFVQSQSKENRPLAREGINGWIYEYLLP